MLNVTFSPEKYFNKDERKFDEEIVLLEKVIIKLKNDSLSQDQIKQLEEVKIKLNKKIIKQQK